MITHTTKIRVRYGDTDKMGYVYYGTYPLYYEEARTELMRSIGMSYKQLEDTGVMLPVHHMEINYVKPAFYDELLQIKVILDEIPRARLTFKYEVFNEKSELLNTGITELVFVHQETMKPCRAPQSFLSLLEPYF
ncbi:MAG: thioesterase [Bacteroidetes bacterium HGW-Bacteroidetes-21]|jgi:acyl-CoA thioester hydrolase|nr:MAG: thioesterase [Bacteroidetes bacterium HGW-Bacteroidetes-21]